MKLLQINYNNQNVTMELVTYWDLYKGVSHKLEVCALKKRRLLQGPVQLSVGVKVQL